MNERAGFVHLKLQFKKLFFCACYY